MVDWKNSKLFISRKRKKDDGRHVLSARRGGLLSAGVQCLLIEDVARCFISACNFQDDHLWRQGMMALVFSDAGVAKWCCSKNSCKVR